MMIPEIDLKNESYYIVKDDKTAGLDKGDIIIFYKPNKYQILHGILRNRI